MILMLRSVRFLFVAAAVAACGGEGTPALGGDATPPDATSAAQDAPGAPADAAGRPGASTGGAPDDRPAIIFLGNSLTAGYGLTAEEAYPALIQAKLDSAGYRFRVVNAGVSGETSAGGLRRVDWVLNQPVAVLVLALGANDALRGQDLDRTRENLQAILDKTRARHPDAALVIAGMQAPPNLGSAYTDAFRRLFVELAEANGAALIPFLLEGVAAVPSLNQADGIHPTAEGQRILAENVWRVLEPIVRRIEEGRTAG
jgi:acyl-CoA thioesterase-1